MSSAFIKLSFVFFVALHITSCGQNPSAENKTNTNGPREQLGAIQFDQKIQSLQDEQLIDVRTPEEFAGGHIAGAMNLNFNDKSFKNELAKLDKNKPLMIYCLSGGRSSDAAEMAVKEGFKQVFDMKGGTMAWSKNGLPLESAKSAKPDSFTTTQYQELLKNELPLLIDYYAPWCGPCKKMEPVLEKLKAEFSGKVRIERINVDEAGALTKELGIENIPVISSHKEGKEIAKVSGYQSEEQLRALIEQLLR